jgi:hypothetical protein
VVVGSFMHAAEVEVKTKGWERSGCGRFLLQDFFSSSSAQHSDGVGGAERCDWTDWVGRKEEFVCCVWCGVYEEVTSIKERTTKKRLLGR